MAPEYFNPMKYITLLMLSVKKQPDNFGEIFKSKAQMWKYFKEKCSSVHYKQLSFKMIT